MTIRISRSTLALTLLFGVGLGMALQAERTRRQVEREGEDLLSVLPPDLGPALAEVVSPLPHSLHPLGRAPGLHGAEPTSPPAGGIVRDEPDVILQDAQGRALPGWLETDPLGPERIADVLFRVTGPHGPRFHTLLRVPHHQLGTPAPYWYEARPSEAGLEPGA